VEDSIVKLAERVLAFLRDEQHWVKGMSRLGNRYCLVAAADEAGIAFRLGTAGRFLCACADVIREQYPERTLHSVHDGQTGWDVAWFNDHEDTTYADVRRVIEKVIAG
jgi:hypothetical protein